MSEVDKISVTETLKNVTPTPSMVVLFFYVVTSRGNFVNLICRLDGILWRILLLLISVN
jgi:hypothetical protein